MTRYLSEMEADDIHIEGIDAVAGCALYYDDVEMFVMILRSFATNTPAVLEEIKIVNPDSLMDYQLRIHGIKSTCATIGAEVLCRRAYELEMYAKDGNVEAILQANDPLIADVYALIYRILAWLDTIIED